MNRLERVRRLSGDVAGVLITEPLDLAYLTGISLSAGLLFIGEETTLFVDGRYLEVCQAKALMKVVPYEETLFKKLLKGPIAFDSETTSFQLYQKWSEEVKLLPIPALMKQVRAVKEGKEIASLKKAAALCSMGYDHLVEQLEIGIEERELARAFELFCLQNGGEALSFEPIIAFGSHGAYPHYHSDKTPLQKGDSVLFDLGFQLEHYQSDMTRLHFFGKVHPEIEKIYLIVQEAMKEALEILRPGVEGEVLDRTARAYIEKAGYGEAFIHSLGHGVGLEVHEYPLLRKGSSHIVEEGMVVTIEPGIYLPGIGGVRLEDTVVVTADGWESLTLRPFSP